jgi:hypothetical protein
MTEAGRNHTTKDLKNVSMHNRLDIWVHPGPQVGLVLSKTRNLKVEMQKILCAAAQSKGLLFQSQLCRVVGSSKRGC